MPEISEDEVRDAILKDPTGYFKALHDQGLEAAKQMLNRQGGQIYGIIKNFSEELAIFRALEMEMRYDTINQEGLITYLKLLQTFRERVQAEQNERNGK